MALRSSFNKGLKWYQYIPWVVSVSFTVMVIGLIIWAAESSKMVGLTASALKDLGVNVESSMNTWGKAWIAWMATMYALMAVASLSVAVWRRYLKVTSDVRGHKAHVSRGWLMCHAVIIGLWWTVMLLLLIVIVGQTAWLVTSYSIDKAAIVGADSVQRHMNASAASPSPPGRAPPLTTPSPSPSTPAPDQPPALVNVSQVSPSHVPSTSAAGGTGTSGNHTPGNVSDCNLTCVDLSAFSFVLGYSSNNTCICQLDRIRKADVKVTKAMEAVSGSTAGAVMMFIAATWMLMGAASDHGSTHRELALGRMTAMQAETQGLLKQGSFWKRGKKGKTSGPQGGADAAGDVELGTVDEEGGEGSVSNVTSGSPPKPKPSSSSKARASSDGSSSDQSSLLFGKLSSSRVDPPPVERSSQSMVAGTSRAISHSFSSALSSAKKGGTKIFTKAMKLGF